MRYSFTSRPIAVAVTIVIAIPLTSAAPTQSSMSSFPNAVRRSNQDSTLALRDLAEHEAYSQVLVTPSHSASPHMAIPTGGMLLEANRGSNLATVNTVVGDSCTPDLHGYHIAVLVLLSCTFVIATFNAFYSLYRQWSFNRRHNRNWPSVNVFSPPGTPKRKPRLSLSLPDIEKAMPLRHKTSTSTLPSISEEPTTPARVVSFVSPHESSRPPSYSVGDTSLLDSPSVGCFPMSPNASSHRSFTEGQSSFHPLQ
ncbi:hypothetical protein GSI_10322 [Ganoderma sinense ZZ0214-1]|uniref:Transporter n=1 Tax=Ganoderma sinense ZZ0214-1 TaxID=1077348 RepID=A0A2G8S084_9APHY|nr:hypothetical protein GSI_10322 [Ganoderma sinense ZZ0214-1]